MLISLAYVGFGPIINHLWDIAFIIFFGSLIGEFCYHLKDINKKNKR